jgi:hypothetical protein
MPERGKALASSLMLTNEQKRLREKLGRLMARRALLPEVERSAINAEIEVAAGQLARLVAIACAPSSGRCRIIPMSGSRRRARRASPKSCTGRRM